MTRGLPHALCRLLALLACVMCGQSASRVVAQPRLDLGASWAGVEGATVRADLCETGVSVPAVPAGLDPESPASEPREEERESDDDEDLDDDFDGAQPLGLRGSPWDCCALPRCFGAPFSHDPVCSNHRLLDPRPPRRR
jgi:hypothetical protein